MLTAPLLLASQCCVRPPHQTSPHCLSPFTQNAMEPSCVYLGPRVSALVQQPIATEFRPDAELLLDEILPPCWIVSRTSRDGGADFQFGFSSRFAQLN